MRQILTALAAALAVAAATAPALAQAERPMFFESDDRDMNAAIAEARRTLPMFWRAYELRAGEQFTVKVAFDNSEGGREHLWIGNFRRNGDAFTGQLVNAPALLPGKKLGDWMEFSEHQISDWSYVKNNRLWGSFTTRVILSRMDPSALPELRAFLSPTPVEPGI